MRLIKYEAGVLELRWTWLPYWMVVSPTLKQDVERTVQDAVLLNGITMSQDALDRIDRFVLNLLAQKFPIPGVKAYLQALHRVVEPVDARGHASRSGLVPRS